MQLFQPSYQVAGSDQLLGRWFRTATRQLFQTSNQVQTSCLMLMLMLTFSVDIDLEVDVALALTLKLMLLQLFLLLLLLLRVLFLLLQLLLLFLLLWYFWQLIHTGYLVDYLTQQLGRQPVKGTACQTDIPLYFNIYLDDNLFSIISS